MKRGDQKLKFLFWPAFHINLKLGGKNVCLPAGPSPDPSPPLILPPYVLVPYSWVQCTLSGRISDTAGYRSSDVTHENVHTEGHGPFFLSNTPPRHVDPQIANILPQGETGISKKRKPKIFKNICSNKSISRPPENPTTYHMHVKSRWDPYRKKCSHAVHNTSTTGHGG